MRRYVLALSAACAMVSAACLQPAAAVPAGPTGLKKAAAATDPVVDVVYICKQRYWSGKRYCYWRPGGYRWHWRWRWRH